jgi:DNA-binding transcriptional LysR family regulator
MPRNTDWEQRLGRRVRLRDLNVLIAVIQAGSMAQAAAALGITQPAVSASIADLEFALGVRLLDRGPRGVSPTPYGQTLLRRGRAAFDELRQGIKEIEHMADPASGEIHIACTESIAAGALVPIINRLSERYPRVSLRVSLADTSTLAYPQLHARSVDLVVARLIKPPRAGRLTEQLNAEVLFNDRFRIVASAAGRWARRARIDLSELASERWISTPLDTLGGMALIEMFRRHGLEPPNLAVTTFSLHLRNALGAGGGFVAALPESVLRLNPQFSGLKILPVDLPMPPWPVGIVTLRNRALIPAAQLFVECAREAVRDMTPRETAKEATPRSRAPRKASKVE